MNHIQYDKLYDFGGIMNLYPEFAQEASVGNLLSLKKLFLLDFEDLCYDRYIRELQVFQLEEFSADLVGTEVTEVNQIFLPFALPQIKFGGSPLQICQHGLGLH